MMLSSISDSKRIEQICKPNGWRKPDQVDVQCKRDGRFTLERFLNLFQNVIDFNIPSVNDIALEMQNLKNSFDNNKNDVALELKNLETSLVNNNLLDSCTIRGATNDWYQSSDTVVVEGIF